MALFDRSTAVAAALKSVSVRRAKREALAQLVANPLTNQCSTNDYPGTRLARVRRQLDKLDLMIEQERDPQKLDRLAGATSKLAEQERQLSGRSLPVTFKAREVPPPRRNGQCREVLLGGVETQ